MKRLIIIACLALTACDGYPPGEYEFVCYTLDKLTERHVGVHPTRTHSSNLNDVWHVVYVDAGGGAKRYKQRPGESCGVEQVR